MNQSMSILAIDQGTTSSRAIVFDRKGRNRGQAQKEFRQIFPGDGWVEHDPMDIWNSQLRVLHDALRNAGIGAGDLGAIGITNQRETALAWDRESGNPLCNAIVWQDRRTAAFCDRMRNEGMEEMVRERTGLVIDPYFSATKWKWMLENVPAVKACAEKGQLALGTVDSWLVWKLTGGEVHATDVSNASRTMLFNIHTMDWDPDLMAYFGIGIEMLPELRSCSEVLGHTAEGLLSSRVPIAGMAGDQQAATFGQMCLSAGDVKCTYGTGCFILFNTGPKAVSSENKLLTTVAWQIGGHTTYALEGSIFIGGAVVQWLRDGLGLIRDSSEIEALAESVEDNGGVYFVPAFTGLGAPHWDPYARGMMTGLTRAANAGHIARAALESIAFQVQDVLEAMEADAGIRIGEMKVDGGAAVNDLLMQFQSEISAIPVVRPESIETTALGAAFLAGLATGFWESETEIRRLWSPDRVFMGRTGEARRRELTSAWKKAIARAQHRVE